MIRLTSSRGSGTTSSGKRFGYSIFPLTGMGQSATEYQLELQVEGHPEVLIKIVDKGQPIDFAGEKWVF
ncbi:hypothetical protein [Leuconostoc lactis]|uniref:hypothetical protein n=1 Tax=Leuconostoc lactis TaxID=1246 RepID=UPI0004977F03|nr:hypothetical protein [Leuconostoc lactis]MDI6496605.1 hypothetical protein [Leuconostoc lactis]PAV33093.1 hypothetical protein CI791_07495 [Leuconostoc lactis]WKY79071.1 hypothetical protein PH197_07395 [Leuconostoc lactis]